MVDPNDIKNLARIYKKVIIFAIEVEIVFWLFCLEPLTLN